MKTGIDIVDDLIGSQDEVISGGARKVAQYTQMRDSGELTASEYAELCEDVLDLKHLDDEAVDLERKIAIVKAFEMIKAAVGALPVK